MYEIPEVLIFVCVLLLFGIGATASTARKRSFILAYYASASIASIVVAGLSYAWIGVAMATGVLLVWLAVLKWLDYISMLKHEASMGADEALVETR